MLNSGMFSSGLIISHEQLVIDNEIVGYIRRILRGFEVNERTLAVDVIREIGPGGNFMQELDEAGVPRLAYRTRPGGDRNQMLLFAEDREFALLREVRDEIETLDLSSLTPLDALNILSGLKGRLRPGPKPQ